MLSPKRFQKESITQELQIKKLALSLLIFFTNSAFAQSIDRAPYAIQSKNFNCEGLINSIKSIKNFQYSWLYNTFGEDLSCLKKINALPQTKLMEVHLINETCQRNGNCGEYEFLNKISVNDYEKKLVNEDHLFISQLNSYIESSAKKILPTLNAQTSCFVSPGLESNLSINAAKKLIEITKKYYGNRCQFVWNPLNKKSPPIEGTIYELHGTDVDLRTPCVANLDGIDIDFKDRLSFVEGKSISIDEAKIYLKKYSHCAAAFIWIAEDNCREAKKIDPRFRNNCTTEDRQFKIISLFTSRI